MRGALPAEFVDTLDLDLNSAGVCLACLTFVAFPLELGDERKARQEARRLTPILWEEGLELTVGLALETAKRDARPHARDAIDDVRCDGARSAVAHAIVWRLAELMVEDMRRRSAERQSEPSGAIERMGWPVTAAISSKSRS
jgi:hypothetical protein